MIDRTHVLPISRQAKVLNISRGTVYYQPRPVSPKDLRVMRLATCRLVTAHYDEDINRSAALSPPWRPNK